MLKRFRNLPSAIKFNQYLAANGQGIRYEAYCWLQELDHCRGLGRRVPHPTLAGARLAMRLRVVPWYLMSPVYIVTGRHAHLYEE